MVLNIRHDVVLNIFVTFSGEHCEAGAKLRKALHKGEFLKLLCSVKPINIAIRSKEFFNAIKIPSIS